MARSQLYEMGEEAWKAANALSDARDKLDGFGDKDQVIRVDGKANIVPSNPDGIAFRRTPQEVPPERTPAMVEPNSLGFGATVRPEARMISAFSAALSPAAEMIAPAWPIRRPFGAVRPATKPTTGFVIFSLAAMIIEKSKSLTG